MAKRMSEQWNSVIEEFETWYPNIAEKVVDWYPSARCEITVKTDDGEKFIFDWLNKRITRINQSMHEIDTCVDEDAWKQQFAGVLRSKAALVSKSINEISEMTGISRQTLSKYFNGRSMPSGHNIYLISKALECSVSELTDILP
jgi:DNA-binding phage protein